MRRFSSAAILAAVSFLSAHAASADDIGSANVGPTAPLNEQVLYVPGDPDHPVTLQVTVFTPDGPGPFPLAVVNHGADGKAPSEQQRYRQTYSAFYFLSRGYAVVLPMMRGFAGSGGRLAVHGCDDATTGLDNAKDIRAVIDYMAHQPGIDGSRVVVAGQSFGGWNTLALGTLGIPNVKGSVNFSGGMIASNCADPASSLVAAAGQLGASTKVPSIWFYGDNDKLFATTTWHAMYDRYTAAGGKAELVAYGKFGQDSHQMLSSSEGLRIWAPRVDAFLTRIGLPGKLKYPAYVPTEAPPASHYAAIDDVESVPYIGEPGKALYQRFLAKELPRAVAIASNGNAASYTGGFDPIVRALADCGQHGLHCELYAVDNDVVWRHPAPVPPPSKFAALSDVGAIPYLSATGREGYKKFLTLRKPRAFVIARDGAWYLGSRGPDPIAAALDGCGKLHRSCRLYAVDNDIVWKQDD